MTSRFLGRLLPAALCLALLGLAAGRAAGEDEPIKVKPKPVPKVEVGKPAPAIDLPATEIETVLPDKKGGKLSLADFKGKKNVVLYFYPRALTSGCTKQSCGFRDKVKDFAKLDTVIVGISTDPLSLQQKFTDKHKFGFPLFADADKDAARAYGVLNVLGMASRTTFVIDKNGVVRKIFTGVNAGRNPDEALDWVRANLASR